MSKANVNPYIVVELIFPVTEQENSGKHYFEEVFTECYQDARLITSQETGLDISIFPVKKTEAVN